MAIHRKQELDEAYLQPAGYLADQAQPAAVVTTATAVTLSVNQLFAAIILQDPSGGAVTTTTPTAALIVAALKNARPGANFVARIRNTADVAEMITVAGGTGVTISGTATIAQNNSKEFLFVVTVATLGSEAVTAYSLGTVVH